MQSISDNITTHDAPMGLYAMMCVYHHSIRIMSVAFAQLFQKQASQSTLVHIHCRTAEIVYFACTFKSSATMSTVEHSTKFINSLFVKDLLESHFRHTEVVVKKHTIAAVSTNVHRLTIG